MEINRYGVRVPTLATMRKYGLDRSCFDKLCARQHGLCAVCFSLPDSRMLVIDHEHVKGFKKLPPQEKRKHVRGLLCTYDNFRMIPRGMTRDKANFVASYLNRVHTDPWWQQ